MKNNKGQLLTDYINHYYAGNAQAFADAEGYSKGFVSKMRNGHKPIAPRVRSLLGIENSCSRYVRSVE